jgi:hypothetical protein
MQRLTLSEQMAITDTGAEELKSKRRRRQFACAFSCDDASARLRYTGADCVAVVLTADLARAFGAKQAASIVLMFGDVVLRAIAQAEAATSTDVMLGVNEFARESDDRRGHFAYCGRVAELEKSPDAAGYTVERVVTVNVSRAIRIVRANAARLGVDLSGSLMPPPDSAEFDAIMTAYTELPPGIVESNAYRQRTAAARRAGEKARAVAMGGRVVTGSRKQPQAQAA